MLLLSSTFNTSLWLACGDCTSTPHITKIEKLIYLVLAFNHMACLMFFVFLRNTQHTDGFMETAGFMAESVEKIFHLAEQVSQVLISGNL